jgi:hypothetical protein
MTPAHLAAFRQLIRTPTLPELGPGPRPDVRSCPELIRALDAFFTDHAVPPGSREPLQSAALLWHDHLDESHRISQDLHDASGSLLHGIMHRREPDYGNAKYWFARVGTHPAYAPIAQAVQDLLSPRPDDANWRARLLTGGRWNPNGFVDACEELAHAPGTSPEAELLRQVLAIEFDCLLPWL